MKPLTIEQFDVSVAFILDPATGKYGLTFAKFVSSETSKSLPPIRIDGWLKVFMNKNEGKKSFSLTIAVDETNKKFFEKLEHELASLASSALCRYQFDQLPSPRDDPWATSFSVKIPTPGQLFSAKLRPPGRHPRA